MFRASILSCHSLLMSAFDDTASFISIYILYNEFTYTKQFKKASTLGSNHWMRAMIKPKTIIGLGNQACCCAKKTPTKLKFLISKRMIKIKFYLQLHFSEQASLPNFSKLSELFIKQRLQKSRRSQTALQSLKQKANFNFKSESK